MALSVKEKTAASRQAAALVLLPTSFFILLDCEATLKPDQFCENKPRECERQRGSQQEIHQRANYVNNSLE